MDGKDEEKGGESEPGRKVQESKETTIQVGSHRGGYTNR